MYVKKNVRCRLSQTKVGSLNVESWKSVAFACGFWIPNVALILIMDLVIFMTYLLKLSSSN